MIGTSEFIRGYTEIILCSLLYIEDDYIYNLVKKILHMSNGKVQITYPSVLMIVKKMVDEKKVISYDRLNEKGVNRKFYALTDKGRQYYKENYTKFIESLISLENLIKEGVNNAKKD